MSGVGSLSISRDGIVKFNLSRVEADGAMTRLVHKKFGGSVYRVEPQKAGWSAKVEMEITGKSERSGVFQVVRFIAHSKLPSRQVRIAQVLCDYLKIKEKSQFVIEKTRKKVKRLRT